MSDSDIAIVYGEDFPAAKSLLEANYGGSHHIHVLHTVWTKLDSRSAPPQTRNTTELRISMKAATWLISRLLELQEEFGSGEE